MKLFNYELKKIEPFNMKKSMLDKAQLNAETGVIQSKLELRHHTLLLEQLKIKLPKNEQEAITLEAELKLTEEAIERDKKSINNWETQLKAIQHERN